MIACRGSMPAGKNLRNPNASCCGEADAYYADNYRIEGSRYFAIITDDRIIEGRSKVAVGTEIEVPARTLDIYRQGNPTGHVIIFLAGGQYPICYFPQTGD